MRGNTISIELPLKRGKVSKTIPLYQYDYGQKLIITGAELPEYYEVHFSNEMHGDAVTSIGDSTGVLIPDALLATGENVYLWLYLHADSDDGETEFQGAIPVIKRAQVTDQTPTPAEQSVITQAIAALTAASAEATAAKEDAEAAQQHIENMGVAATTLPTDSDATVTKTVNSSGEVTLTFGLPRGVKGDRGDRGLQGETGNDGEDGEDGVSPSVSVTDITGGHRVSITDASGTETFDVMDGADADPSDFVADEFSSSSTYAVGDYVMHDGKLYECSTAVSTAGEWDSDDWTEKQIADQLCALKTEINSVHQVPSGGSSGQVLGKASGTDYDLEWKTVSGGGTVDSTMSTSSTNPVQNKVITKAVKNQNNDFANSNEMTAIEYTGSGYIITDGSTADVTSIVSNSNWEYALIQCVAGDKFVINADGGSSCRAWAFIAQNGSVLSKADSSNSHPNYRNEAITAPTNTKYLVINNKEKTLFSYKGEYLYVKANKAVNVYDYALTSNQMTLLQYTGTGYISDYRDTADVTSIISNTNWRYMLLECNAGDRFTVNANGGDSCRAWAFISATGVVLAKADSNSVHPYYRNEAITAPTNTKYLVINDKKSGLDSYSGVYDYVKIQEIEEKVDTRPSVIKLNIEALNNSLGAGVNKGRFTSASNPDSFMLLHFSDIHGSSDNMANISHVREFLEDVLDDTLCTGDIVTYYSTDAMTFWDNNSDGSILTCIGNHDVKVSGTTGYIESQPTEAEQYAKYMSPYISNWGTVEHSGNNLYYYKDYATKKIRLIVLNLLYNTEAKVTEQNTWLATALAGAKTAGYGVVIGQHYYPVSGTKISCTFSAEVNFPSSMSSPGNYMYNGDALTTYQSTVQSFIDGGGNFVCWLCGHKHADYIVYHPTYPKQIFIGVGGALLVEKADEYDSTSDMRRIMNTRSQDCMNMLAIDPSDKKIKIIRIGCDRDIYNRHRGTLVLDYSTSPATVVYND